MPNLTATPQAQPTPAASPFAQPWPDGVTHRYANLAGATVDISSSHATGKTYATCTGCPWTDSSTTPSYVHGKAQGHAERCRALARQQ